jgi:hypothetical protein
MKCPNCKGNDLVAGKERATNHYDHYKCSGCETVAWISVGFGLCYCGSPKEHWEEPVAELEMADVS